MKSKAIFLVGALILTAVAADAAIVNPNGPATRGYVYGSAVATREANEQFTIDSIAAAAANYATATQGGLAETAIQEEIDPVAMAAINNKADKATTYTKTEVDNIVDAINTGGFDCIGTDGQYLAQITGGVATCVPLETTNDTFTMN